MAKQVTITLPGSIEMKRNGLNSIVIQRRTVAKTELSDEGAFRETANHEITDKYNGFDSLVDWENVYDAVVDVIKKEVVKHL